MSALLPMEKLNNVRDLGGMAAADGRRIRKGLLIRSGHLFAASEKDREFLQDSVRTIVDFRSDKECREKPEPELLGVTYVRLPVFREIKAGVTRDAESNDVMFEMAARDPQLAEAFMRKTYESFLGDPFSVRQFRRFLDILLEAPGEEGRAERGKASTEPTEAFKEKAVLWHCTAGKDRTGVAAAIVETILGVSREDVYRDYLATNKYLKEEVRQFVDDLRKTLGEPDDEMRAACSLLFETREEYLDVVFRMARERCGSFEDFLTRELSVTENKRERFREKYLE